MDFQKRAMTAVLCVCVASAAAAPGVSPGPGVRYATDAYPGFDRVEENTRPERKEPKWFSFINGPKKSTAAEQFAWARTCEQNQAWSRACDAYDALVRQWPTAPEAPRAQKALADLLLEKERHFEEAFSAYRYLLDFYSVDCDFSATAETMYKVAELMREEGRTIVFFRFANTDDVRRAYESLVLRAPGAAFVPQAMLTIASLREEAGDRAEAIVVYENLRNIHPQSPEALASLHREARVRMALVDSHGYNRDRVGDTGRFLKQALRAKLPAAERADLEGWLARVGAIQEEEAYRAAVFYDSRMRTRRSAINAYERFLASYPSGRYADAARERLRVLKEQAKQ
jgi:outer membrane protein assembly factor BamD (BamD/ComL family)